MSELHYLKGENERLKEKLFEAIEHLNFTLWCTEKLIDRDHELLPGNSPMFYHTGSYEGDMALANHCTKAREFLNTIQTIRRFYV